MSRRRFEARPWSRLALSVALSIVPGVLPARAGGETKPLEIDLPKTLELAGARSLDVEIARQDLRIARAEARQVRERFYPWLTAGAGYRRHEGAIQNVEGFVLDDVDKEVSDAGAAIQSEVPLGDALFAARAARRTSDAAEHALDAQYQDALLVAVLRYFDLLAAQARIEVFSEAERISAAYGSEIGRAVEIGLSARSEELRVQVETEKYRLAVERAREDQRVAAARLAEVVRLGGTTDVVASRDDIAPVSLVPREIPVETLVGHALTSRGELRRSDALVAAARERRNGAAYGPLLPSVNASAGFGYLGGGPDGEPSHEDGRADYAAGLQWRFGPGGLFDLPRIDAADAALERARLGDTRLRDLVTREVVEAHARSTSLARRLETSRDALATAERSLALSRERREFGVDVVLENVQAEQEQTRTRAEYLQTVIDLDKAEYALLRALGGTLPP